MKRYKADGGVCAAGHICKHCQQSVECAELTSSQHVRSNYWHKECRQASRQERNARLRSRYGISLADYERMLTDQNGRCKICSDQVSLVIDHSHSTRQVRGLLCVTCNIMLGYFNRCMQYRKEIKEYLVEMDLMENDLYSPMFPDGTPVTTPAQLQEWLDGIKNDYSDEDICKVAEAIVTVIRRRLN